MVKDSVAFSCTTWPSFQSIIYIYIYKEEVPASSQQMQTILALFYDWMFGHRIMAWLQTSRL